MENTDIDKLAVEFGLEPKVIKAVMAVESAGSGFDSKTKLIKIQFEPTIMHQQLLAKKIDHTFAPVYKVVNGKSVLTSYKLDCKGLTLTNGVELQTTEYIAYNIALQMDKICAMNSTSFGLGQIMGFNNKAAGYATAEAMINDFMISEYNQLKGMLNFMKSNKKMFSALLTKDFATFAYYYNGSGYKKYNYDVRIKEAYDKLK